MHETADQQSYFSFFDVDARSEICHIPGAAVATCPRIGEQVDFLADLEEGGGLYTVVNVRHVLQKGAIADVGHASIRRIVIELKPNHSAPLELETAVALEIPLEELAALPIPPDVVSN